MPVQFKEVVEKIAAAARQVEQAGGSAKAAAGADGGLSNEARESVLAAHLVICKLKANA